MITLHHLWCVKTTRLQTEYVFGEQEKLQRGKSGKQGRQRAKNVLELVCAPPPQKKDSCGLDASHWWISSQQQWWTSTWKLDQFDKEKMLFCSFSLWLRKSKLKTAFMLEGSTKTYHWMGNWLDSNQLLFFLMFRLFRNWCWNGIHKYINCCLI